MSTEAERLQWRRNKALELSSQGRSQPQMARILQVGLGTVTGICSIGGRKRRVISENISTTSYLEYQKCLIGLDSILAKTWDIANNEESSEKDKLQAISVGMQAYGMKLDLLTSAMVVDRAIQFVERYRANKPPELDVCI